MYWFSYQIIILFTFDWQSLILAASNLYLSQDLIKTLPPVKSERSIIRCALYLQYYSLLRMRWFHAVNEMHGWMADLPLCALPVGWSSGSWFHQAGSDAAQCQSNSMIMLDNCNNRLPYFQTWLQLIHPCLWHNRRLWQVMVVISSVILSDMRCDGKWWEGRD